MSNTKYKSVRRIAIGGMAEVLLASQQGLGGFERLVVIKRILPQLREDQEFLQMFLDEARLAARLQHPNVVETLDVFREEETFNVALEYISGEDLRYIIGRARKREIKVPVAVACRVISDIAAALAYAHQSTDANGNKLHLVHRDVAPSNIIVSYNGNAKLIDFGIAKANISHIYTRPGTLKGKFAYMSPEQIQHSKLDGRSDIFSLGIVLHEMLTARRLFKGTSQAAVLKSVMEHRIPPPSEVNAEVPPELDAIVLHALARDREDRIRDAGELADRLDALHGGTIPHTSTKHVAKWMTTELKDRREHRGAIERQVIEAAREPEPEALDAAVLPPLFSTARTSPSGSSTGDGRSLTGSHRSTSAQVEQAQQKRPRPLLWLAAGAAVMLLLMLVAVLGYFLGRDGSDPGRSNASTQQQGPSREATLVVHALPHGAQLSVDGKRQRQTVGPDGLMVPLRGGATVKLVLSKPGYVTGESQLTLPEEGTRHVHIQLNAATGSGTAIAAADPQPPVVSAPQLAVQPPPSNTAPRARRGGRSKPSRRSASRRKKASARPAAGSLLVAFTPPNAAVLVDGARVKGPSPRRIAGLSPGRHVVRVEASGHQTVTREAEVKAGQDASLDIRLTPKAPPVGMVDVVTVPSGASITVDAKPKGRAPIVGLRLTAGKQLTVTAQLAGYRPWTARITPTQGRNPTVVATLTALKAPKAPVAAVTAPVRLSVPRSMIGSKSKGLSLFRSRCNSCHGVSAKKVWPSRYTRTQWSRYFANGRHDSKVPLKPKFTRSTLADVKAYLMSAAADVEGDTAAGVR